MNTIIFTTFYVWGIIQLAVAITLLLAGMHAARNRLISVGQQHVASVSWNG